MYTNVNLAAPLGVLALLGTAFVLALALLVFVYTLITSRRPVAKATIFVLLIVAGVYLGLIILFSFASNRNVLARGQEKHFCEIDCHLAYSVVDVKQSKTLGDAPNEVTAAGLFYTVTIKTRFDETTISAHRGNGLLYPNPRLLSVVDEQGRQYSASSEGQRALAGSSAGSTPISAPLRPSESYTTTVVFDLPTGISKPTLLINEGDWITHLIIGHENSPGHRKTWFQL